MRIQRAVTQRENENRDRERDSGRKRDKMSAGLRVCVTDRAEDGDWE